MLWKYKKTRDELEDAKNDPRLAPPSDPAVMMGHARPTDEDSHG
jgi:hypothetical protein